MEVKLVDLCKEFKDRSNKKLTTVAVEGTTLTIPSGKLIGLLGPSGCGKSTTLYMISGLQVPTRGRIYFGEEDVTELPPEKRGIGLVFQNYALYPHMTVRQNIMFPLLNNKVDKKEALKISDEMARLVDLEKYMDRKPSQLSGGQQQRVAIARALAKSPKVLLLDEPLSNLDARLRLQTREEIKRIQKETGITTIFVTHDQEEAMSISDEIVVMSMGKVQQVGAPQDVYDEPANMFVAKFLGNPAINIIESRIEDGNLYVGRDETKRLLETGYEGENRNVFVGIRPESFMLGDENSPIKLDVDHIEHIGRDVSIIGKTAHCEKNVRIIVSSEFRSEINKEVLFFNAKKYYAFEEDGKRIK